MNDNTIKGLTTELHCQLDFATKGIVLSRPIIQDSKYDFIADIYGRLFRIQCKSSTISKANDYIVMRTKSTNIRNNKVRYYSKNDIDYFYTYYDNKSYLVPVECCEHGETRLRFTSKNLKNSKIKWAKNYEFNFMIQTIIKK